MPPSREDIHEQLTNERSQPREEVVARYDPPVPLIARVIAWPFTVLGNLLNWWRS